MWLPLLDSVPFSASRGGFQSVIVRAVDPSYSPVLDLDLRTQPVTAAELLEIARAHLQADAALETRCFWDLWVYDLAESQWKLAPQPLEIFCYSEEYDSGAFTQNGHFMGDLGFEHLFTGHAGLLASRGEELPRPQDSVEARFLDRMKQAVQLHEYHKRTRENIRRLQEWMQRLQRTDGVKRLLLWSEGEENFEARLDDVLALR
ncbi:MAG TPA: hypothetical protein VNL38_01325 [Candidatus Nitrosotenuis sp.]|nr:hypothetical protein [Candidatus Nitrosotenuis sp.]